MTAPDKTPPPEADRRFRIRASEAITTTGAAGAAATRAGFSMCALCGTIIGDLLLHYRHAHPYYVIEE